MLFHAGRQLAATPLHEIEHRFGIAISESELRFGGVIGMGCRFPSTWCCTPLSRPCRCRQARWPRPRCARSVPFQTLSLRMAEGWLVSLGRVLLTLGRGGFSTVRSRRVDVNERLLDHQIKTGTDLFSRRPHVRSVVDQVSKPATAGASLSPGPPIHLPLPGSHNMLLAVEATVAAQVPPLRGTVPPST